MHTWQQFVILLAVDNDQSWEDYQSVYAEELIKNLDDQEWSILSNKWRDFDERSQARCASLLANVDQPRAVALAAAMIEFSTSDLVAFCAADSLRLISRKEAVLPEAVLARVEKLRSSTSGLKQKSMTMLLEKISPSQ